MGHWAPSSLRPTSTISTGSTPTSPFIRAPATSPWCPLPGARDIRGRLAATLGAFGAVTVIACLFAPLVGSTPIHLGRVFDRTIPFTDNLDAQIFFVARLPRVLAA